MNQVSGTNTGDEPDASTSVKGVVELATTAETTTGTDTTRATTPAGVKAALDAKAASDMSTYAGVSDRVSLWQPPTQPAAADIVAVDTDLAAFVALWDGLVTAHPTYVTRTTLGLDETGVYPLYRYVFEPTTPEKTIILTANIHGGECEGQRALYRFMYHVANDFMTYPQLAYLRTRVRFVIIPIANPYGLVNGTRQNGNTVTPVDLARNFNYGWTGFTSGPTTYKGTAALSEVESQYIDATLAAYPDAVAYLDIHNTSPITPDAGTARYYIAVPCYSDSSINTLLNTMDLVTPAGLSVVRRIERMPAPTAFNQAAMIYRMHGATVEWLPGAIDGVAAFSAGDMTAAVQFIGNAIIQYANILPASLTPVTQPFAVENSDSRIAFSTTTTGAWEDVPDSSYTFTPGVDGIVEFSYAYTFHNTTAASINYVCGVLLQEGNDRFTASKLNYQLVINEVYHEPGGKRATITVSRRVPVYAADSTAGAPVGPVTVKLMVKTDAGAMAQRRMRMSLMFTPSDTGKRWTFYYNGAQTYPPTIVS